MSEPPTPPYTEATKQDPYGVLAEDVALRTARRYGLPADQNEFELAMMHAALDAVTAALHRARMAGLLLPEGAETRTEWTAPPEPGSEVAAVTDKHGRQWNRHAGLWCYTDDQLRHTHLYWHELFFSFPLTDATPATAVRLAEGDPSNGAAEGGGEAR